MNENEIRKLAVVKALSDWEGVSEEDIRISGVSGDEVLVYSISRELSNREVKHLSDGIDVETENFSATVFLKNLNVYKGILTFDIMYWKW